MRKTRAIQLLLLSIWSVLAVSCSANDGILKSGKDAGNRPAAVSDKLPVEKEIEAMRTAGFSFIYMLRRKDGGKIDAEDKGVIRMNTAEANRRITADDDKAFIVGSNNQISPKFMMVLSARFAVENYSPEPIANANVPVNANK